MGARNSIHEDVKITRRIDVTRAADSKTVVTIDIAGLTIPTS